MNCWRDESLQERVGGFVAYSLRGLRGSVRKERLLPNLPGGVGRCLELLYRFIKSRPLALATILL